MKILQVAFLLLFNYLDSLPKLYLPFKLKPSILLFPSVLKTFFVGLGSSPQSGLLLRFGSMVFREIS